MCLLGRRQRLLPPARAIGQGRRASWAPWGHLRLALPPACLVQPVLRRAEGAVPRPARSVAVVVANRSLREGLAKLVRGQFSDGPSGNLVAVLVMVAAHSLLLKTRCSIASLHACAYVESYVDNNRESGDLVMPELWLGTSYNTILPSPTWLKGVNAARTRALLGECTASVGQPACLPAQLLLHCHLPAKKPSQHHGFDAAKGQQ